MKQFRESLGITQAEFSRQVGIHKVYICQLETGVKPMGHKTALIILERYRDELAKQNVTLENLLRGERTAA